MWARLLGVPMLPRAYIESDRFLPRGISDAEFSVVLKSAIERRRGRSAGAEPAAIAMPDSTTDQTQISETLSVGIRQYGILMELEEDSHKHSWLRLCSFQGRITSQWSQSSLYESDCQQRSRKREKDMKELTRSPTPEWQKQ